ncbi:hypothetical protein [Coleofasciculus sp. E2-BRE-01]|uniref:hypothetical protein n=1 Tax=Coleofasciculus sp. E2-BRE-01 TaxID=3069524 RepID=UPI003301D4EA
MPIFRLWLMHQFFATLDWRIASDKLIVARQVNHPPTGDATLRVTGESQFLTSEETQ